jgi:hypothetical protein
MGHEFFPHNVLASGALRDHVVNVLLQLLVAEVHLPMDSPVESAAQPMGGDTNEDTNENMLSFTQTIKMSGHRFSMRAEPSKSIPWRANQVVLTSASEVT